MLKPNVNDYLIAHPFFIPLWVWAWVHLFHTAGGLALFFISLLLLVWLFSYVASLHHILEHDTPAEEKEVLSCTEYVKT